MDTYGFLSPWHVGKPEVTVTRYSTWPCPEEYLITVKKKQFLQQTPRYSNMWMVHSKSRNSFPKGIQIKLIWNGTV